MSLKRKAWYFHEELWDYIIIIMQEEWGGREQGRGRKRGGKKEDKREGGGRKEGRRGRWWKRKGRRCKRGVAGGEERSGRRGGKEERGERTVVGSGWDITAHKRLTLVGGRRKTGLQERISNTCTSPEASPAARWLPFGE